MIGALILGVVAGGVARWVIPDDAFEHLRGWRSWVVTIALGLVGALLGWLIFTGLFGIGDTDVFDLGGVIGAIVGAILVLLVVSSIARRTRPFERWD
ncbi:MAG TPA: GlsB/YeaQ/YmgE family stress response membrane protein [Acidimicrobiia bacterium]|nr:GlsB/YeaQ/YmgE family stress response membrane protein [Acidimicrobiia bacterium]